MSHCNDPSCRTGSFEKRWISRTPRMPPFSVPSIARPLSAPRAHARNRAVTFSQRFEPDVAECHRHRLADVHLESEEAAELTVLQVVVHQHAHDGAVEDLGDRVA